MRWIDIVLPGQGISQEFDDLLAAAVVAQNGLDQIQAREGLDNVAVTDRMAEVGRSLFQAVMAIDTEAFNPDTEPAAQNGLDAPDVQDAPLLGIPEHDHLRGYHLVVPEELLNLPWAWLHNGVDFLLARHPLCVGVREAAVPTTEPLRPWMQRFNRARFILGPEGEPSLTATIDQLQLAAEAQACLLFVPGHSQEKIRRLIYREAETIENALEGTPLAEPLARIEVPTSGITPAELVRQGITYQGIHFAGPTSVPANLADTQGQNWMNRLADEVTASPESQLEEIAGLEGEVLGVDPITTLLDTISEKVDQLQHAREALPVAGRNSGSTSWLLEDGPVPPESIGQAGGMPPLVFSNNYRGLPELGSRFLGAGASTFIGPLLPLYSRSARIYAGYFYEALACGWSAGAALWRAAHFCRQEMGTDHPAWLSYGIQGSGSLALQYL